MRHRMPVAGAAVSAAGPDPRALYLPPRLRRFVCGCVRQASSSVEVQLVLLFGTRLRHRLPVFLAGISDSRAVPRHYFGSD